MKILITSVNLRYSDDEVDRVDVRFRAYDDGVNINGDYSLTADDYKGKESTESLVSLAKQRLESGLADG